MKVLNRRSVLVLRRLDLRFVDEALGDDIGRGRPLSYPSQAKLKALLLGWSFRERAFTRIAGLASSPFGRAACGLRDRAPSHDALTDFFHLLEGRIEDVFARLVGVLAAAGLLGRVRAIDATLVPAYKNDRTARNTWDSLRRWWARGYGLHAVVDRDTHAVLAARVRPVTNASADLAIELADEARRRCGLDALLGDSEFDMLRLDAWCREHATLPVVLRNPRRHGSREGPKYRVQVSWDVDTRFLDALYRQRVAVEQTFKGLKADLGMDDVRLRGIDAVRVHVFLVLIWRNLQVLDAFLEGCGRSLRSTMN